MFFQAIGLTRRVGSSIPASPWFWPICAGVFAALFFANARGETPSQTPEQGIQPAPLRADREELPLPSAVDDACVGGEGRFFILHLPASRSLAIFDVNEAKVVKYLPTPDEKVRFAADRDRLFVVAVDRGFIQRYSLRSFEKELTVQLQLAGTVRAIAAGSASRGPLLVQYATGPAPLDDAPVTFLDPVSLNVLRLGDKEEVARFSVRDAMHYRASPDGTVFGAWITSQSQSMSTIVVRGKNARIYGGEMAGSVLPREDNVLVTGGGLYTEECKLIPGDYGTPRYRLRIPSATGPFYLACPGGGAAQFNTGMFDKGKPVTIYLANDPRAILTLDSVELPASNEAWTQNDFTQDKRVLFVPEGKLIATIPNTNDRLVLYRFDLDAALEKANVNYLYVRSCPPFTISLGKLFTYRPLVKSKMGGIKLKFESAPDGMRTTADGNITWQVPRDFAEKEVVVIMTISDASGQSIFHTFRIAIDGAANSRS